MLEVITERTSPFCQCQLKYGAMLSEPVASGPLRTPWRHYGQAEEDQVKLLPRLRNLVLSIGAQLHFRFHYLYSTWPYDLLSIVDARCPGLICLRSYLGSHFSKHRPR